MMRYLFLFCIFLISTPLSWAQLVIEDPNAELRQASGFHSVHISGAIDVFFTKGDLEAIAVSAPDGLNRFIVTEMKDGVLNLSIGATPKRWSNSKFKVYISYTELQNVSASGASFIKFAEPVEMERLSIDVSGAGKLQAEVKVERLSVNLRGASDMELSGTAAELSLISSGASDFKSPKLTVKRADIRASGASDTRLNVEEYLTANVSGASDIYYTGNPRTEVKTSGASNVSQSQR